MKTKTKMLLGIAGLTATLTTQKACFDNVKVVDHSSDEKVSGATLEIGSTIYVGGKNYHDFGTRSFWIDFWYSNNYNDGGRRCSPKKSVQVDEKFLIGNQAFYLQLEIDSKWPNERPCAYSSFSTGKVRP